MSSHLARVTAAALFAIACAPGPVIAAQARAAAPSPAQTFTQSLEGAADAIHPMHEISAAMIRLPVAALLGAALALRPRRRGTPPRDSAVVQTQIVLAVVGAVIMLVVGASLARAFGIVGAANLIRYRSKIDDPKDAVVMLGTLSVGLASGVGLYALTVFSTAFLVGLLWVIESFEPKPLKRFTLTVKAGKDTDALRPKIEPILTRFKLEFELSKSSDEEVCYDVLVPFEEQTDRVSNAILQLDPDGHAAVEWAEKKNKAK
ncbi:MAG: MgtC/SapB family protein [Acidobacteriota bacterium]